MDEQLRRSGNSSFTFTNGVNPILPQQFYLLQLP
jgi:hypothetical protein